MRKNCSSDQESLLKFEAEGWEFAKCLRRQKKFTQTVKGQNIFLKKNAFLTCSWIFFRSNTLEELEFRVEKIIGIQKPTGKVRKYDILSASVEIGKATKDI